MASSMEPGSHEANKGSESGDEAYTWLVKEKYPYVGNITRCFDEQYNKDIKERMDDLKLLASPKTTTVTCDNLEIVMRNENNLVKKISRWFNDKDTSDIQLKVGKYSYYCHKLILSNASPFLEKMIKDCTVIELDEKEDVQELFEIFIKFFYSAQIKVNLHSLDPLLSLAIKYQVDSLKTLCMLYMLKCTRYLSINQVLEWYILSQSHSFVDVALECKKNIAWNIEKLINSEYWLKLDLEMIIEILKSSNLIIHSEYVLFQAILKWLETKHGEQFTEFGELLLPFIRFPYLKPIELAYAETMFSENQRLRKLCMKLIKEAFRFCVLSPLQALIDVSFAQSFFNPRNYTSLAMHKMTLQSLTEGTSTPKLVKTCVGPVPTKSIETYWNLFHILSKETLNLWLYPENSALIQDLLVKALIVISNEDGHIFQVEELENECSTEKKMSIKVFLKRTELKNNITVILKCYFK